MSRRTLANDGPGAREALERLFDEAVERATRTGRPQWLSLRVPVPLCDALALFAGCESEDAFYWEEPARDLAVAALGRLHAIETSGAERIEEAARLSRELIADHQLVEQGEVKGEVQGKVQGEVQGKVQGDAQCQEQGQVQGLSGAPGWAEPLLVGGFAFSAQRDPETGPSVSSPGPARGPSVSSPGSGTGEWAAFGDGRLVLPEFVFVRHGGQAWLRASCRVEGGSNPARARAGLEARSGEMLARIDAEAAALGHAARKARVPAATALEESWRRFPSAPGLPDAGVAGPEYRVRSDRSHARYCAQVQEAREAIARGELEKVVLARSLSVAHDGAFDLPPFLDTLRRTYPSCATLAVRRGRHCFVSASPERLVELTGDRVETVALAGTAPRGRSPEEDERMGRQLRESKKDQEEHAIVKRAIERALAPLCGELEGPETPGLMRFEGIQHLETPLLGRLDPALDSRPGVLDLVARLHPTPAVGGAPSAAGRAWIEANEGLDRGWYAGPVGFVTAAGEGRFRVALRSARISGGEARLFAGAGIVEASWPEDELRETRLKLRALLAPLTEI